MRFLVFYFFIFLLMKIETCKMAKKNTTLKPLNVRVLYIDETKFINLSITQCLQITKYHLRHFIYLKNRLTGTHFPQFTSNTIIQ